MKYLSPFFPHKINPKRSTPTVILHNQIGDEERLSARRGNSCTSVSPYVRSPRSTPTATVLETEASRVRKKSIRKFYSRKLDSQGSMTCRNALAKQAFIQPKVCTSARMTAVIRHIPFGESIY